jgi:lysophospholipase L1-like esterase
LRNLRLILVSFVVMSCSPAPEPGTGGTSGTSGGAGTTGTAGAAGGSSGTSGSAGTSAGGTSGGAGTGGDAGAGGAAGGGGAAGSTGGRGGTGGGAAGTGGANGGRGGSTGGAGGTGGAAGQGGAAGRGGTGGTGGTVTDGGVDRVDTGSDGGGFNPCPATGNCIIMPLGDSITDGVGSSGGGYRVPLFSTTVTNMQAITFVGRNTNGPTTVAGRTFPRNHEGYSGYTIDPGGGRSGISPLVDGAISMFHPHIVLLMIGTNDVNISLDLANAPTRLGALLDRITTDAPNALLVVARLTPTTNDTTNGRVRTYNNAIPGVVQSRVTAGKHIVLVDMYAAFTANMNYKTALMNDELHPNDAGYMVMAQTWYAAIGSYLPRN